MASHEAELKQRLANLKEEALKLANQKKQFVDAKAKAQELNDPMIDQVMLRHAFLDCRLTIAFPGYQED